MIGSDLQRFIYRVEVLKLYRNFMRVSRRAPLDARGEYAVLQCGQLSIMISLSLHCMTKDLYICSVSSTRSVQRILETEGCSRCARNKILFV